MGQEEELLRIAKKLEKMVARKNTEGALDLLKKLNSCQMSIQLLQTTRIGVAVNGVRKHCSDKEVVSLAKVLIRNWKRLLDSPAPPKGEKGEGRVRAKKKEKGLDCSSWKPETSLSPPRKKHVEEPKDRRDSVDSKSSATSSPKRPSMERSNSSKSKAEAPRTPSSPSSPTFAPSICLLAPCYLTGDSVRDKCVEMLSAALKADDDYKDYGVNCDKMASEIEDHILELSQGCGGLDCPAAGDQENAAVFPELLQRMEKGGGGRPAWDAASGQRTHCGRWLGRLPAERVVRALPIGGVLASSPASAGNLPCDL
ncbi:transcription elongation factor A protein 3 isoform X3 [Camelus ferus]|uniref:Transcription elongation factor A protein 3 isoform X3 n=1 Tax=Camelus ferus TaxID=419612 RepID=A0A8B8UAP9_CAMFR|nr:transcription elongation factor A protein 3 isoform X3 [Camelus ferus]